MHLIQENKGHYTDFSNFKIGIVVQLQKENSFIARENQFVVSQIKHCCCKQIIRNP